MIHRGLKSSGFGWERGEMERRNLEAVQDEI